MANICNACGAQPKSDKAKQSKRLPRGWKRVNEEILCERCKSDRYRLVAVTIPVAGPVDMDWQQLRQMLRDSWAESTACANWLMTELYARDCRREPSMDKLPKWKPPYLYPETSRFRLPSQSRAAMEQAIKGKYRAIRYELLWTNERSLANHRYPYPYAVPNQAWRAEVRTGDDGKSPIYVVSLPLVGIDGRVTLRLSGSHDYRRQLVAFRQIAAGEAVRGECVLYRVRARDSDGRNGDKPNESGKPTWRILCKMVAYLPRIARKHNEKPRFFTLRTDGDSFVYGVLQDREEPWLLHADGFRDQCYQHKRWLSRMADDSKHERRRPKRRRAKALREYDARGKKFHDRQKSFVQMTVAQVMGFSVRSCVTRLRYDDTIQTYMPSFPYFVFCARLAMACQDAGIEFEHVNKPASGKVSDKSLATARDSSES